MWRLTEYSVLLLQSAQSRLLLCGEALQGLHLILQLHDVAQLPRLGPLGALRCNWQVSPGRLITISECQPMETPRPLFKKQGPATKPGMRRAASLLCTRNSAQAGERQAQEVEPSWLSQDEAQAPLI